MPATVRHRFGAALVAAATAASALTAAGFIAAPAHADPTPQAAPDVDPEQPNSLSPEDEEVSEPSFPMPVPSGAFSYISTRNATLWMAEQEPHRLIKAMPVPPHYRLANDAAAKQLKRELDAAVATPGACLQIVVNPETTEGNLFDYGFWAVAQVYCPQ